MVKERWIPEPKETVRWKSALFTVISCDMDGFCKIKKVSTTRKIGKKFTVNVSELEQINNT